MRRLLRLSVAAALFASAALSQEISLASPIDCTVGESEPCFIQNYVDHDPGPGFRDFTCAHLGYDGHTGTDFALRSEAEIARGVDVLAVAPGIVKRVRDGMPDQRYSQALKAQINGRDCGNAVVLAHENGWESHYCHLKQGSISVTPGTKVETGDILGEVGMSGYAAFPHVHFSLHKDGQTIDPFAPRQNSVLAQNAHCQPAAQESTLWQAPLSYQASGLVSIGFSPGVPKYDAIKRGIAHRPQLSQSSSALVLWGQAFGARPGDIMRLEIFSPQGLVFETDAPVNKRQARYFRAGGRKTANAAWFIPGTYRGAVTLIRNGETLSRKTTTVRIIR
jgi:hypothetical protein